MLWPGETFDAAEAGRKLLLEYALLREDEHDLVGDDIDRSAIRRGRSSRSVLF